jgi:hypothetical protein
MVGVHGEVAAGCGCIARACHETRRIALPCSYAALLQEEGLEVETACAWPSWQSGMRARAPFKSKDDNSIVIDEFYSSSEDESGVEFDVYDAKGNVRDWGKG